MGPAHQAAQVEMVKRESFPPGFLWGAATAAYQIEGDNRFSDLWDWERRKGWEPSGKAVDSLNRFPEDVRLLVELGANTYRFSIEWGRVMPAPGRPDEKALAYYGRLLDALEAAHIRPVVTLHHFTNPRWFWERHPRGWQDPSAVADFADFVTVVNQRFGARVQDWVTFNEPMVYLFNGAVAGHFPPGERHFLGPVPETVMPAVLNVARAHRAAWDILHKPGTRVGLVQNISHIEAWKDEPRHLEAARRWDWFFHWALLDAARTGMLDMDLDGTPETPAGEPGPKLDFTGVNYYTRVYVRAVPLFLPPVYAFPFHAEVTWDRIGALLFKLFGGRFGPGPKDDLGHELYPEGLRLVLRQAWERNRVPVMVTENGLADAADTQRADYIRGHLRALKASVDDGVPVLGYLYWSLMDNYEWGSYGPKLGLYSVDRDRGLRRRLTSGGRAYQDFLTGK